MAERRALTFREIADLARKVGFPASVANTMAAIALAESGGRYWAEGDNFKVAGATRNPEARYDRGLFQINSMHGYDREQLLSDPEYNARAAFAIYQRQGLNAWTTYKVGAHRKFLSGEQGAGSAGGTQAAGGASSVPAAEEKKPKTRQQTLDWLRENHPDIFGLLQVSPEIKELAFKAAEGEWDRAKIKGALAKTKYYKTTIAAARTWDSNFAQDEVTGRERLARSEQEINTLARQLGVDVSAAFVAKMALNVNRLGWTDLMVRQALAAQFRQSTATAGAGTVTVDTLRAIAAQYAVPVSDHSLTKWTRDILGGLSDENAFRSRMAEHAKRLLPDIADEIDEGRTVRDYFDPYAEIASSLGVLTNPAEFDLSDNKWRRGVMKVDPDTGKRVVRDLDEWETELRTNAAYGYTRTRRGREEAAELGADLARALGFPA